MTIQEMYDKLGEYIKDGKGENVVMIDNHETITRIKEIYTTNICKDFFDTFDVEDGCNMKCQDCIYSASELSEYLIIESI